MGGGHHVVVRLLRPPKGQLGHFVFFCLHCGAVWWDKNGTIQYVGRYGSRWQVGWQDSMVIVSLFCCLWFDLILPYFQEMH